MGTAQQQTRRNAPTAVGVVLPANGRQGPTPKWPFVDSADDVARLEAGRARIRDLRKQLAIADEGSAEARRLAKLLEDADLAHRTRRIKMQQAKKQRTALWKELWSTPQAVMWERLASGRAVAGYVQAQVAGEMGDDSAAKEARIRATELGLTPKGMQNLRWTVAADEVGAKREGNVSSPARPSARGRRGPLVDVSATKAAGDD